MYRKRGNLENFFIQSINNYSQVPRTSDALLMDESDSDETVLFGEMDKDARKPLTSTNDDEESD